jgi:hypothetical protein
VGCRQIRDILRGYARGCERQKLSNQGKARSAILENTADRLISYTAFVTDVTSYPNNVAPVRVAETHVAYIIITKSSDRITELSDTAMDVAANTFDELARPEIRIWPLHPGQVAEQATVIWPRGRRRPIRFCHRDVILTDWAGSERPQSERGGSRT